VKQKAEQKTKLGRISPLFEGERAKQRPDFLTSPWFHVWVKIRMYGIH